MRPDVLFWFYKEFAICRERLLHLRALNDDIRIFALYGGPLDQAPAARDEVGDLVDDFYAFQPDRDSRWKWINGDRMIVQWYLDRGHQLDWESIFIVQWDMLVLAPLEELCAGLQPDEILLSGYRPLGGVAAWWPWADPEKSDMRAFERWLQERFGYTGELMVCLFIVACLPRVFMQRCAAGYPEVGFMEFRVATLARVFDIPVCRDHAFDPWWAANPATKNLPWKHRTLNAVGREIPRSVVLYELADAAGKRLFHPYSRRFPRWMENRGLALFLAPLLRAVETLRRIQRRVLLTRRA